MILSEDERDILKDWLHKYVPSNYYRLTPSQRQLYSKIVGNWGWDYIKEENNDD